MDHPAHFTEEHPWRATALVAAGVAAIELCVIFIIAVVFFVKPLLDNESTAAATPLKKHAAKATATKEPTKAPPTPTATTKVKTGPKLSRNETKILVLNGNGRPGAASEQGAYVQTKGYQVVDTTNAPRSDFLRSVVMYRSGFKAEALRFGRDLGIKNVVPLDGLKPGNLQGANIVLIVGAS